MLDFVSALFHMRSTLAAGTLGYEYQMPSSFSISGKRIPCISECVVH